MTQTIDALKRDAVFTTVSVPREVKVERIMCLLSGFIENGYSSWAHKVKSYEYPAGTTADDFKESGPLNPEADYWPRYCRVPLHDGGAMIMLVDNPDDDNEGTMDARFDKETIRIGLERMAADSPRHFNDILDENDDADTADVFAQYVVYGKEIYC